MAKLNFRNSNGGRVLFSLIVFVGSSVFVSCLFENRLSVEYALKHIRLIRDGQSQYVERFGKFASLNELAKENLIPPDLPDGEDGDYSYEMKATQTGYTLEAYPSRDIGSCFYF